MSQRLRSHTYAPEPLARPLPAPPSLNTTLLPRQAERAAPAIAFRCPEAAAARAATLARTPSAEQHGLMTSAIPDEIKYMGRHKPKVKVKTHGDKYVPLCIPWGQKNISDTPMHEHVTLTATDTTSWTYGGTLGATAGFDLFELIKAETHVSSSVTLQKTTQTGRTYTQDVTIKPHKTLHAGLFAAKLKASVHISWPDAPKKYEELRKGFSGDVEMPHEEMLIQWNNDELPPTDPNFKDKSHRSSQAQP